MCICIFMSARFKNGMHIPSRDSWQFLHWKECWCLVARWYQHSLVKIALGCTTAYGSSITMSFTSYDSLHPINHINLHQWTQWIGFFGKIYTGNCVDFPLSHMDVSCNFSLKPIWIHQFPEPNWAWLGDPIIGLSGFETEPESRQF